MADFRVANGLIAHPSSRRKPGPMDTVIRARSRALFRRAATMGPDVRRDDEGRDSTPNPPIDAATPLDLPPRSGQGTDMHPPAPHSVTAAAPASERAELRATLALATPLVAANLLQMGVYSIDVIFVARLGTTELAAATLGVYLYSVLAFAMIGLVGAAAPLIAAELGRRAHAVRQVRRSFRMAMWLAVVAGLATMAILANGERLLLLTHQDAHDAARAGRFLDILLWATIPAVATGVMRVTASALGRPGWAMLVTGLGLCMGCSATGCWCSGGRASQRWGWRDRRSPAS